MRLPPFLCLLRSNYWLLLEQRKYISFFILLIEPAGSSLAARAKIGIPRRVHFSFAIKVPPNERLVLGFLPENGLIQIQYTSFLRKMQ